MAKGLFVTADGQTKGVGEVLDMATTLREIEIAIKQIEQLRLVQEQVDALIVDINVQREAFRKRLQPLNELIHFSAPEGVAFTSGEHLQMAAAENIHLNAGGDISAGAMGNVNLMAGEKVGLFAHKDKLSLIANEGPIKVEAQNAAMKITAAKKLSMSAEQDITFAGKKRIVLIGGGSYLKLEAGRIEYGTEAKYLRKIKRTHKAVAREMPVEIPVMPLADRFAEQAVMDAMKLLIDKADHYIYIENQFFVSAFGVSSVEGSEKLSPVASSINPSASAFVTRRFPDKPAPENQVAEWLANKIKGHMISFNPMPFHVYIMLPVYPEGRLDDPTIVAQIHLTRQSLVFGSHSLINRIRRTLWVKQQLEEMAVPRKEWHRQIPKLEEACGEGYLDIDIEACYEFVTLLNMRDHGELNGQPVTEQIYVHSKLMIVDDRWVLVGSANINDRSLLGDGDSELAVTIADMDHSVHDLDGSGTPEPCRTFARDLRQRAWRKWMGSASAECEEALDKPALKASWEKIQGIAKKNTIAYETVFNFIPQDRFKLQDSINAEYSEGERSKLNRDVLASSIWPTLAVNKTNQPSDREKMPFSEKFWFEYDMNKFSNKNRIDEIEGYFTLLPAEWTSGENNLIPFNIRLIARNDQKTSDLQLSINSIDNKRVIT